MTRNRLVMGKGADIRKNYTNMERLYRLKNVPVICYEMKKIYQKEAGYIILPTKTSEITTLW